MKYPVPDLCDANPGGFAALEPMLSNFGGREAFYGEITTIKCFEDNLLLKQQMAEPGRGRVMVVDGGGSLRRALLGDKLATNATTNGWAGVVIFGCVRDVDEICLLDLGIQALAVNPVKPEQKGVGDLDVPITFGGVTFIPGHYLYADNNGLIVSPVALSGPDA